MDKAQLDAATQKLAMATTEQEEQLRTATAQGAQKLGTHAIAQELATAANEELNGVNSTTDTEKCSPVANYQVGELLES